MELLPTLISSGWASGVNAYATVLVLGLLGRAGLGTEAVPEQLTETPVLAGAAVMYAIEFVADKVPLFDSAWDLLSTAVRPAIGGVVGVEFAAADELSTIDQALAGGGSGALALVSHAVKASFRLGLNASPEPFTNILASVGEDIAVGGLTAFSLWQPEIAAAIALVLLAAGITLVVVIWRRVRRAWSLLRERYLSLRGG
ncbi:MAG TPA: DUF4126 domain-containing protein [Solirubrobacterales bacterium]|nr:DUF4126 domain-containing protein [Solirubrobacterales bacterium]